MAIYEPKNGGQYLVHDQLTKIRLAEDFNKRDIEVVYNDGGKAVITVCNLLSHGCMVYLRHDPGETEAEYHAIEDHGKADFRLTDVVTCQRGTMDCRKCAVAVELDMGV